MGTTNTQTQWVRESAESRLPWAVPLRFARSVTSQTVRSAAFLKVQSKRGLEHGLKGDNLNGRFPLPFVSVLPLVRIATVFSSVQFGSPRFSSARLGSVTDRKKLIAFAIPGHMYSRCVAFTVAHGCKR